MLVVSIINSIICSHNCDNLIKHPSFDPVIQTASCLALQELHDPDLGSFPMDHDLYCNYKCGE